MKKMLNVCAALLLSIFAFGFTACTAASSSGSSGGTVALPDPPLQTYKLTEEGGTAVLILKDYNIRTFSGNYIFVGKKGDPDGEYTENGPFTISANPGNKGWTFKKTGVSQKADNTDAVSEDGVPNVDESPDRVGPISQGKILTFESSGGGRRCKFNLKNVPLP